MRLLKRFATYVAALAGAIIGIFLVLPFGLVVHELVIMPLALLVGGLLASVGASWAASQLARDQTRTRLLPVVAFAEAGAALAALMFAVIYTGDAARPENVLPTPGVIGIAASLVLALDVTLAAWRFRGTQSETASQGRLMALLLAVAVVSVPVVIVVASLFGLTGA
jgi:hypothetical protein